MQHLFRAVLVGAAVVSLAASAGAQIITENFDGLVPPALPAGWTQENANGDGKTWSTFPGYFQSPPNAVMIGYNSSIAMNDWLFSPGVALTGGTSYTLTFGYRGELSYTERLAVHVGDAAASASMAPAIWSQTFSSATYSTATVAFTPAVSNTYFIGFHGYSNADENYIAVDDVVLDPTPATPLFEVNPTSYDFGDLNPLYLGDEPTHSFTVENVGGGALQILSITVAGADFSVQNVSETLPHSLGAAESLTFDVQVSATTTGAKTADVTITDDTVKVAHAVQVDANVVSVTDRNYGGGGAGNGGYYFANSTSGAAAAPSQPTASWIDITATGTTLGLDDDQVSGALALPFTFTFFGTGYDSVYVSSNGWLTFTSTTDSAPGNWAIPTASVPQNLVAALWHDLNPADPLADSIYYSSGRVLDERFEERAVFVVTWSQIPQYYSGGATADDILTFQVILFDNGNIKLQYNDALSADAADLSTCTIGIENADGTLGVQYLHNDSGGPLYDGRSDLAVMFGTDAGLIPVNLMSFDVE